MNGDGFSDVLVGADYVDFPSRKDAGAAYVIFGRSSGLAGLEIDAGNATFFSCFFRLHILSPFSFCPKETSVHRGIKIVFLESREKRLNK